MEQPPAEPSSAGQREAAGDALLRRVRAAPWGWTAGKQQRGPGAVRDELPDMGNAKGTIGAGLRRTHQSKSYHLLLPLELGASALPAVLPGLRGDAGM